MAMADTAMSMAVKPVPKPSCTCAAVANSMFMAKAPAAHREKDSTDHYIFHSWQRLSPLGLQRF